MENQAKMTKVSDLKPGPTRHPILPEGLMARIKAFKQILADVEKMPLAETIENFQRDTHPEREIAVWECITGTFQNYILTHPKASPEVRRDAYSVLVATSVGITDWSRIQHLSEEEVLEVVLNFRAQRKERGH